MRLDVFGREVEIVRRQQQWLVFYPGPDGKKRLAEDLVIPAGLAESQLIEYLADLCHEWATPERDRVCEIPSDA